MTPTTALLELARLADGSDAYVEECAKVLAEALASEEKLRAVCEALLLFHRGGMWTDQDAGRWYNLTQSIEATNKVLCDRARAALGLAAGPTCRICGDSLMGVPSDSEYCAAHRVGRGAEPPRCRLCGALGTNTGEYCDKHWRQR